MRSTFADDLELGREEQRNRRDPAWCVLRVVAEEFDLDVDPLEERGAHGLLPGQGHERVVHDGATGNWTCWTKPRSCTEVR